MAWDIHGNPLKRGYCEVHSWVAEEYPCSLCMLEDQKRDFQKQREQEILQDRNRADALLHFITYLRLQSFEGWSEEAKNGYLTALKTIEEKY